MQARFVSVISALLLYSICVPVFAQAPPPPPTSPTLWSFLGIPQAGYKINAQLFNRRGNHPALEKKPPLKGIADPENLKSDVPAIKAAAEIKQAEDLAPQKIKAIKYLATLGCGCYDKDKKITKALLAAMDDCTEEVRLAAVQAIAEAASAGYCQHCSQRSCCGEEITNQLYKIAYELDDLGCPVEPSERVREAALEAMRICCPNRLPVEAIAPVPVEGGDRPPAVEGAPPTTPTPAVPTPAVPPPATGNENRAARIDPNHFLRDASLPAPRSSLPPVVSPPSSRRTARMQSISHPVPAAPPTRLEVPIGSVSIFDANRNIAHVHFRDSSFVAAANSRLQVFLPSENGTQFIGEVEVLQGFPGSANVRPIDEMDLIRFGRHVQVVPAVR